MKTKLIKLIPAVLLTGSLLFTACSGTDKKRRELANAEEDALKKTEEIAKMNFDTNKENTAELKEDLEKAKEKLSEKQNDYVVALREREAKLNDKLKEIQTKLRAGKSNKRLLEKKDRLSKERDMVQANILELYSPVSEKELETVEKTIQELIAEIDKELDTD
jgi:paraquat-inducible protein B